jgi:uridine kinase
LAVGVWRADLDQGPLAMIIAVDGPTASGKGALRRTTAAAAAGDDFSTIPGDNLVIEMVANSADLHVTTI